jgi:hypothetical protein
VSSLAFDRVVLTAKELIKNKPDHGTPTVEVKAFLAALQHGNTLGPQL